MLSAWNHGFVLTNNADVDCRAQGKTYSRRMSRIVDTISRPEPPQVSTGARSTEVTREEFTKARLHAHFSSSPTSTPLEASAWRSVRAIGDENAEPRSSLSPCLSSSEKVVRRRAFTLLQSKENVRRTTPPLREMTNLSRAKPAGGVRYGKRQSRLRQMQIDLGQSIRRCCKTCGMDYNPAHVEDTALHKAFHAMNVGGVDLGRANLKTLSANKIWTSDRAITNGNNGRDSGIGWVVAVDAKSSIVERSAVRKVLAVVSKELGAIDLKADELWGTLTTDEDELVSSPPATGESDEPIAKTTAGSNKAVPRFKAYIYIQGDKCIGLCLAERIRGAYQALDDTSSIADGSARPRTPQSKSSSIAVDTERIPATLGIHSIWTSTKYRRLGIASRLLECARKNFVYGIQVPKNLMAFSQPTASGGNLARKWFGESHRFNVYLDR